MTLSVNIKAEIYKYIDENGHVVFTDKPTPNAKQIPKRDVQTIKSPEIPKSKPSAPITKAFKYEKFEITYPANNEVIRSNDGELNVDVTISPGLNVDLKHSLVLILDGKPVSEPDTSANFALHGLDRGQHTLSAKILDSQGKTIKTSKKVAVHIKRYSSLSYGTDSPHKVPRAPQAPRATPTL